MASVQSYIPRHVAGGGYLWAVCSVPDICLPGALHMSQNPEVLPFCRTAQQLSSEVAYESL